MQTIIWKKSTIIISAIALLLLSTPSFALSVAAVRSSDLKPYSDAIEGFKSACDCSIVEIRAADLGDSNHREKILKLSPDVILAVGTEAFRKIRHISNVPILYLMVIPSELVNPLPSNVHGVGMQLSPDACMKSIKDLFPKATKIGLIYDPTKSGHYVTRASAVARNWGLELITREIHEISQIPAMLSSLENNVDLLWMLPDATFTSPDVLDQVFTFSFSKRIPVFTFSKKYVEMGAVASLDFNPYDMGKQVGEMAASSLRNGKEADRTYAKSGQLVINSRVARKIGFRIKSDVRRKAEDVSQ